MQRKSIEKLYINIGKHELHVVDSADAENVIGKNDSFASRLKNISVFKCTHRSIFGVMLISAISEVISKGFFSSPVASSHIIPKAGSKIVHN